MLYTNKKKRTIIFTLANKQPFCKNTLHPGYVKKLLEATKFILLSLVILLFKIITVS